MTAISDFWGRLYLVYNEKTLTCETKHVVKTHLCKLRAILFFRWWHGLCMTPSMWYILGVKEELGVHVRVRRLRAWVSYSFWFPFWFSTSSYKCFREIIVEAIVVPLVGYVCYIGQYVSFWICFTSVIFANMLPFGFVFPPFALPLGCLL